MKRQSSALLLVVSLAFGLYAQKLDDTEANLRRHVEYLASDRLEGRRTGEPGALKAAWYIAGEFKSVGLKPAARLKNGYLHYLQPYPYITGVAKARTGNTFDLVISDSINGPLAQVSPVGFSPNGSVVNAPISFAGYGIVAKEANFDDYAWQGRPMDFKGDVVIVFDGNPDVDNPHSPFTRFDLRTKALIAKEHGAVGMLVISREDVFQHDRLTRMEYDQSLGEAAIPTFVISRETARHILGYPNEASLKTAEELVKDKADGINSNVGLRDVQPHVTFSVNLVKKSVDAYNVIGVLPGTDPKLKSEAIVIGSHYDHLGHGGAGGLPANASEIYHGADDNASGTAAVIELARMFAAKHDNKRTLIFAAFSGNEERLAGSRWYVDHPVFPVDKTVAMIDLDMIGRLKDNKLIIGGIGTASEWRGIVSAANDVQFRNSGTLCWPMGSYVGDITPGQPLDPRLLRSTTCATTFILQLSEEDFGPSDSSSFYGKKVPVLFFFTGTHDDYHKPTDNADKINYVGEHEIVDYITAIAKDIDKNPRRPTYMIARSSSRERTQ